MCQSDKLRLPPAYLGTCVLGGIGRLSRFRSPSISGSDENLMRPARVLIQTPYGSFPITRSFDVCLVCPHNWATKMNPTPQTPAQTIRRYRADLLIGSRVE